MAPHQYRRPPAYRGIKSAVPRGPSVLGLVLVLTAVLALVAVGVLAAL